MKYYLILFISFILYLSCNNNSKSFSDTTIINKKKPPIKKITPEYSIKIKNVFPHDSLAYTQGLLYLNGFLYESTGLRGHSSIRKVDIKTGKILKIKKVNDNYFAEGLEIINNEFYLLTWNSGKCFVYNDNFQLVKQFSYFGEGWGLTHYQNQLIMSDGTNILRFINPKTFKVTKNLIVKDGNKPVTYINELENINDDIWGNIYESKKIVIINPKNGLVKAWVNISSLYNYLKYDDFPDVLNGIAYDKENNRIFLTGKLWKYLFEIELVK